MNLLHDLITRSAATGDARVALCAGDRQLSYGELAEAVEAAAGGLIAAGLGRGDRVAVYLPKRIEAVVAMFAAARSGAVFVPVNPVLKPAQVAHILRDSGTRTLVTSGERAASLAEALEDCPGLQHVVLVDDGPGQPAGELTALGWSELSAAGPRSGHRVVDIDPAAILYTSGSTGRPKGVVLSHRNMVCGALSVAEYLCNTERDRLLAALPFSFDYGFSQLSTAFSVGGSVALMEYLLPRDVLRAAKRFEITGLAAVPPLWVQLADLEWPAEVTDRLRYVTNSGGAMPSAVLAKLRKRLPRTDVYLMYGLTEAFRSTYLPPEEVDRRPTSMGKAIPNAEVLVVRPDGSECAPGEPGELVHRGALVSLGYWNDAERTAQRFRPLPRETGELPLEEIAVWSGDTVVKDEEGYLYFVGRRDEMIKTSGYRVSPTEVEEVVHASGLVAEAVAVGAPHRVLGQAVVVVAAVNSHGAVTEILLEHCRGALPSYMVPAHVEWRDELPRNANGKIDRRALAEACAALFAEAGDE